MSRDVVCLSLTVLSYKVAWSLRGDKDTHSLAKRLVEAEEGGQNWGLLPVLSDFITANIQEEDKKMNSDAEISTWDLLNTFSSREST